ncbi:MAG: integration host factor subunit beta [Deltaproteobacteria bacterium]|nr:MAG: integration host factor subunit beta [Deltaproteobacteria bacterium]
MLKKDLIDRIKSELSLPAKDAAIAVDAILQTVGEALQEERRVELRRFGSFTTRTRKARSTKNPKTGAMMNIPARKTVHFTMSRSLKDALITEKD